MAGKKSLIKYIILLVVLIATVFIFYDLNYGKNVIGSSLGLELKNEKAETPAKDTNVVIPESSIKIEENGKSTFVPYGKGFMHFTRDGVKFYSGIGSLQWSDVYTIISPTVITGGEYSAVMDILGKTVRVYNASGHVYTIQTEESICYGALNKNGNAVLILNGKDDYKVQVYNASGQLKFQRFDEETGVYPVSADLSDDNKVVAITYTDTSDIELLSKVLFFYTSKADGSSVKSTDLFAACEVKNEIIASLNYMSGDEYLCVSDKAVFAVNSSGETVWRKEMGNEISKLDFSEEGTIAVGLGRELLTNTAAEEEGTVLIFNFGGKQTGKITLDRKVTSVYCNDYYVVVADENKFYGIKANGNILWEHNPSQDINTIIPMDNSGKVLYVAASYAAVTEMSR